MYGRTGHYRDTLKMTIKQLKKRRIFEFSNPKRADVFGDKRTKRCRTRNAKLRKILRDQA